jgi:peptidoglycan/LPS O-acetylase OafA/YrhL
MTVAATPHSAAVTPPVPRGRTIAFGFVPGLDGIRAVAVLGVLAYHGGAPLSTGGFLGVNMFFVLSGFLITSLLLGEWARRLTIRLGHFWTRRARRLLPALLLLLIGVAAYAHFFASPGEFASLRLDSLSTLFYVANWHFIVGGSNYFAQSAQPSPLAHMWSLAIEEQFYIVWPPVVLALLHVGRRLRPSRHLWRLSPSAWPCGRGTVGHCPCRFPTWAIWSWLGSTRLPAPSAWGSRPLAAATSSAGGARAAIRSPHGNCRAPWPGWPPRCSAGPRSPDC